MVNEIIKSSIQVTKRSVREIYEYCVNEMNKPEGKNTYFSLVVYANEILLKPYYDSVMENWYDERADEKFVEYQHKRDEIIIRNADRTNDGKIVYDAPNQPRITENAVEFENAINALNETYNEVLTEHTSRMNANNDLMNEVVTIPIFNLHPDYIPDDLSIQMVGYFASNVIKELFSNRV